MLIIKEIKDKKPTIINGDKTIYLTINNINLI
jgi:hypothetical protein